MRRIWNICVNPQGIGGTETFSRNLVQLIPNSANYSFQKPKASVYNAPYTLVRNKRMTSLETYYKKIIKNDRQISLSKLRKLSDEIVIFNAPCDFDKFDVDFFKRNYTIFFAHSAPDHVDTHHNYFGNNRENRLESLSHIKKFVSLSPDYIPSFSKMYGFPLEHMDSIFHTTGLAVRNGRKPLVKTVGTICRIDNRAKRLDKFLSVADSMRDVDFIIYGSGDDTPWLSSEVERRSNVEFRGPTGDIAGSLSNIGVFLMTSDYEGFGISLIEALSQGVPVVIGANTFANAKVIVDDGRNGIVHDTFDATDVCSSIRKIFRNYETFSDGAIRSYSKFSPNAFRQKWIDIISDVLDQSPR